MNDREKRIWDAAYAQAFVADFYRYQEGLDIDAACRITHAELPAIIADLAVIRLRECRRAGSMNGNYVGEVVETSWPEQYEVHEEDTKP